MEWLELYLISFDVITEEPRSVFARSSGVIAILVLQFATTNLSKLFHMENTVVNWFSCAFNEFLINNHIKRN